MLISPLYKYVAAPQAFAYMPPVLAGASMVVFATLSLLLLIAGFSTIISLLMALGMCIGSAIWQMKEPHIHNMLLARQKFMYPTPNLRVHKGKFYVG